ncbi:hypothetical protein HPB50_025889 [Hyalomma asiaticum]|uniref:Uncharacterized protein n=1 Tax=Hyalomma asiaticum TaxID=266040 RepID=A0ACB7TUN4_HYAAI|nr:hypothetical protein HPB50_025889 [Hyalomma asiaticum]
MVGNPAVIKMTADGLGASATGDHMAMGCHLNRLGRDVLALGNLCSLKLVGNSLKTLTPQLSGLPLRTLVVSQNNIEKLPPELFEDKLLNSLQYLDISDNKASLPYYLTPCVVHEG